MSSSLLAANEHQDKNKNKEQKKKKKKTYGVWASTSGAT